MARKKQARGLRRRTMESPRRPWKIIGKTRFCHMGAGGLARGPLGLLGKSYGLAKTLEKHWKNKVLGRSTKWQEKNRPTYHPHDLSPGMSEEFAATPNYAETIRKTS